MTGAYFDRMVQLVQVRYWSFQFGGSLTSRLFQFMWAGTLNPFLEDLNQGTLKVSPLTTN